MLEYNLNCTVVNFQIPQSHISSSFENKLKFYVNNRNVVLLWEWRVNIAKVRANNNLNPVSIFFRNLWRNAHRSVVVCRLLTARNAKLAVLPQNSNPHQCSQCPYTLLPRALTQLWPAAKVEESRCFRASASIVLGIAITMAALFPLRAAWSLTFVSVAGGIRTAISKFIS